MIARTVKTAGFCFGVKRAVDTVYRVVEENPGKRIYTYGPVVHNESVIRDLTEKGVQVIENRSELLEMEKQGLLADSCVIIRAHGISDSEMDFLKSVGSIELVDATCPYVTKIHDIVREHEQKSEKIVVAGDPDHPEVIGIAGCCRNGAIVLRDEVDAARFTAPSEGRICLVAQTTFNRRKFEDIVEICKKKMYDVTVVNTICNATQRRQSDTLALARECDAMIVIGGKNSSNTAKLYDICRSECRATYFIQCLDDLKLLTIDNSVRCIGITAGASTPKTIIEEVLNYVRTEF